MTTSGKKLKFPEVVLFDLDGTLIDNSEIVVNAYATGMKKLGYTPLQPDKIASLAGKSTYETAKELLIKEEHLDAMDIWFWKYFDNYCENIIEPPTMMNKVIEVITYLSKKSVLMGVVTSNSSKNAKFLLKKAELDQFFTVIVGKEDIMHRKPHPEPILKAIEKLNADSSLDSIWMVGDTESDIKAAKSAKIISVGIPQVYSRTQVIEVEPDLQFQSMVELLDYLKQLDHNRE